MVRGGYVAGRSRGKPRRGFLCLAPGFNPGKMGILRHQSRRDFLSRGSGFNPGRTLCSGYVSPPWRRCRRAEAPRRSQEDTPGLVAVGVLLPLKFGGVHNTTTPGLVLAVMCCSVAGVKMSDAAVGGRARHRLRGMVSLFFDQRAAFFDGLLVDGYQVVVAFGQSLAQCLDDGFGRHDGAETEQCAQQHHVVGL